VITWVVLNWGKSYFIISSWVLTEYVSECVSDRGKGGPERRSFRFTTTTTTLVPRLVKHKKIIFWNCQKFLKTIYLPLPKIWKKLSGTLASLFSIMPNLQK
jgi:hypothetical protein